MESFVARTSKVVYCLIMSCYAWFYVLGLENEKSMRHYWLTRTFLFLFLNTYAIFNHLKCIVFPLCPGSPILASEDRVLGGVIVLRCCRCVEAQPSQNFQGILGKMLIISRLGWLNWQVGNKMDKQTKVVSFRGSCQHQMVREPYIKTLNPSRR